MSLHLASSEPPSPASRAESRAERRRVAAHELIEMGTDLARLVHSQALAAPETAADATIAFDRIARTVRRTIMLARKVAEPMPIPADPAPRRAATRRRIIREVEDVIQRSAGSGEAEALHREFLDRLDAPDLDDDIAHRPAADIIVDICRDLGLSAPPGTHPWQRRTPADIAILCARAAAFPTSPPRSAPALWPPGNSDPPDPG